MATSSKSTSFDNLDLEKEANEVVADIFEHHNVSKATSSESAPFGDLNFEKANAKTRWSFLFSGIGRAWCFDDPALQAGLLTIMIAEQNGINESLLLYNQWLCILQERLRHELEEDNVVDTERWIYLCQLAYVYAVGGPPGIFVCIL